jgi:uncharacterized RDD family membrane protein YckC
MATAPGNAGGATAAGQSVDRERDILLWLGENRAVRQIQVSRMNSPNPYAPPQAKVVDIVEDADDLELAGAGVRLGAYIIDTILATVVLIFLIFAIYLSIDNERGPGAAIAWLLTLVGAGMLIWLNVLYVIQNGQSIAKKWLGIKVVRSDGSPASLGRIFWLRNVVNNLISGVFGLYFIVDSLLIFSDSRQCVHDKIADTIVVVA